MRETELKRLIMEEFLSVIQDPRVDRTRKHSLETIIVVALLAVICAADSFVAIERFARAKKAWLLWTRRCSRRPSSAGQP